MIVTRTPLRISLAGGGTDVPAFYNLHKGVVINFAIDKYVYITVNEKFDGKIRLSYSITENVPFANELKHDLARECLRYFSIYKGIEITSVADIPGEGSGLGSSSSFTVGLLAALSKKTTGKVFIPKVLAETAHIIETNVCGHNGIGKQDQYAAAYGGFKMYEFANDTVNVMSMPATGANLSYLQERFVLLYTGITRSASTILREQTENMSDRPSSLVAAMSIKSLAVKMGDDFSNKKFYKTGEFLSMGWFMKKKLADGICNPEIDMLYELAMDAGAYGGKLLGAGGGGFFLFFAEESTHEKITKATRLRKVPFSIDTEGSKVIYDGE